VSNNFERNQFQINLNGHKVSKDDFKVVWFRRWHSSKTLAYLQNKCLENVLSIQLTKHLKRELFGASFGLFSSLENAVWIDHPSNVLVSFYKLEVLMLAKKAGLCIPETLVTNNVAELKKFATKQDRIIAKPISEIASFPQNNILYTLRTEEVDLTNLESLKGNFFYPSLFQELIEKEFEIRIFYLDGDCHAMAIFSQQNTKTQIDFRNYDLDKPNRVVPFCLPNAIEEKITLLMEQLNLRHGSIDMIKARSGTYVFLEVNPVGQFGMVSKPCNYFLEKKVAEILIKNDN